MFEIYLVGLTIWASVMSMYISSHPDTLKKRKISLHVIDWYYAKANREASLPEEYFGYSAGKVWAAIAILIFWPLSIMPCAGAIAGMKIKKNNNKEV